MTTYYDECICYNRFTDNIFVIKVRVIMRGKRESNIISEEDKLS